MHQLARHALPLIAVVLTILLAAPARARTPQVYLIQNSGWMEPFYSDSKSQLRPLTKRLIELTAAGAPSVTVASFNQAGQVPGEPSPRRLYAGVYDPARVGTAVDTLRPARKASGAFADTDLHGALQGAVRDLLGGGEGVVWIVTNNKDSPDNSAAVNENTRRFYREVQSSPSITAIVAFLVLNPVKGEHFSEEGLVVYGLAKGPGGARALEAATGPGGRLREAAFGGGPPLRLKPLDRQPVRFEVTGVRTATAGRYTADTRGGVLRIRGVEGGEPAIFRLEGRMVNALYPFEIRQARVEPVWTALQGVGGEVGGSTHLRVAPERLRGLRAAGRGEGAAPVTLDVALPPLNRPAGSWLQAMTAEQAVLRGVLDVRLSDVELAFDPHFLARAYALQRIDPAAPGAEAQLRRQLPEIFYAHEGVGRGVTRIPVELTVAFSAAPLLLFQAGLLLLALLLIAALIWVRRPIVWRSPLLGENVRLKPGQEIVRAAPGGGQLSIRRPLLGAPRERLDDPRQG